MKKFIFAAIIFNFSGALMAQDVCCILGKATGESAETQANVRSTEECKPGSSTDGYKVCSAKEDPNNDCPSYGEKERCTMCGYFWAGKSCMKEDPVAKAKKELEEEAKKKEGRKKKEKGSQ
jgi:hypothetical protein